MKNNNVTKGVSYHYFDHDADMGIVGQGKTLEEAFISAAHAIFAIISDLTQISPKQSISVEFIEDDIELALVTWLNQLLAKARAENIVLCRFQLQHNDSTWRGQAWGEAWRPDLVPGVEVKGATLTMLSVTHTENTWQARCVIDM